ncbi:hypothetical protein B0H13DRAFT_1909608 [Mycena leptocephala]|nr:hypothetical protein B0H13DRAFT_1909608 [Mycena leptocephala]
MRWNHESLDYKGGYWTDGVTYTEEELTAADGLGGLGEDNRDRPPLAVPSNLALYECGYGHAVGTQKLMDSLSEDHNTRLAWGHILTGNPSPEGAMQDYYQRVSTTANTVNFRKAKSAQACNFCRRKPSGHVSICILSQNRAKNPLQWKQIRLLFLPVGLNSANRFSGSLIPAGDQEGIGTVSERVALFVTTRFCATAFKVGVEFEIIEVPQSASHVGDRKRGHLKIRLTTKRAPPPKLLKELYNFKSACAVKRGQKRLVEEGAASVLDVGKERAACNGVVDEDVEWDEDSPKRKVV